MFLNMTTRKKNIITHANSKSHAKKMADVSVVLTPAQQVRFEAFQRREDHVAALRELRDQRAAVQAAARAAPPPDPVVVAEAITVAEADQQSKPAPRPSSRLVVVNKRVQKRRDQAAARKAKQAAGL